MSNENDKDNYNYWSQQSDFSNTQQGMASEYRLSREEIPRDESNSNPYGSNQGTYYNYGSQEVYQQQQWQQEAQGIHKQPDESSVNLKAKRNGKGKRFVKFAGIAIAFGLIAGVTFVGVNYAYYELNPDAKPVSAESSTKAVTTNSNGSDEIATTSVATTKVIETTDVSNVVSETMPSIVAINSTITQSYNDWFGQSYDQDVQGSGSGIIIGKNDKELLIATNNHVIDGAKVISVQFIDEEVVTAVVKGKDSTADLAVIAVKLSDIKDDTMDKIKIAKLGDSDAVKVGQMAIAIGNALGYGQSTTVGYISATEREVTVEDKTMTLLQTDAAINPGNSGGALLNINGEVIGINSVKYADSSVEGMGFAIPISRANPIINELMNRQVIAEADQGYLGITGASVSTEMIDSYDWPKGVYVDSVLDDGPAKKAGIIAKDIITKINDIEVTSMEGLKERVNSFRAGTDVKITVQRLENGSFVEKTFTVNLAKKSEISKDEAVQDTQNDANSSNGAQGEQPNDSQNGGSDELQPDDGGIEDFFGFPGIGGGN
jgi:serine protease Do